MEGIKGWKHFIQSFLLLLGAKKRSNFSSSSVESGDANKSRVLCLESSLGRILTLDQLQRRG